MAHHKSKTWPKDVNQKQFILESYELATYQLAEKYKCNERTIRDWKELLRFRGMKHGSGGFPTPARKSWTDQIHLKLENYLVLGDIECPDHNAELLDMVVSIGHKYEIEDLVLNGDAISMDSISSWAKSFADPTVFADEVRPLKGILVEFLKHFPKTRYLPANHERRLAHLTEGQITFADHIADMGCEFTEYPYLYVHDPHNENNITIVGHPDNFSRVAGSVPRNLARTFHYNLITGHTHRLSLQWDDSGKYFLAEGGHARKIEYTAYRQLRFNTYPQWNAGFVLVINSQPHLINPDNIDFYLR